RCSARFGRGDGRLRVAGNSLDPGRCLHRDSGDRQGYDRLRSGDGDDGVADPLESRSAAGTALAHRRTAKRSPAGGCNCRSRRLRQARGARLRHPAGAQPAQVRSDARQRARHRRARFGDRRILRASTEICCAPGRCRPAGQKAPHLVNQTACGGGNFHRIGKRIEMFTFRNKGRLAIGAAAVGVALTLSGCASGDPLAPDTGSDAPADTIVVGSQAYYSNEIIAEIYSQALENAGFTVERSFNIGQRDVYMPALEAGDVDVFPEYTGNLLQFYNNETTATQSDEVYAELQ